MGNLAHRYGASQPPQDPKLKIAEIASPAARAKAADVSRASVDTMLAARVEALEKAVAALAEAVSSLEEKPIRPDVRVTKSAVNSVTVTDGVTIPVTKSVTVAGIVTEAAVTRAKPGNALTAAEKQRAYRERIKASKS